MVLQAMFYLLPFIILLYYLWANWPSLRNKPLIPAIYFGGIILWLSGIIFFTDDIKLAALIRACGIVVILAGVCIDSFLYKNKSR